MKTSPELLTDILGVLGNINQKLGAQTSEKAQQSTGVGASNLINRLLRGERGGDGISKMADSVKKLNDQLNKVDIKKLNNLIKAIDNYNRLPKDGMLSKKTSNIANSAKDMSLALIYTAAGVLGFVGAFAAAKAMLGLSPFQLLGFITATFLTLGVSMLIISGMDAAAGAISNKIMPGFKGLRGDRNRNKGAITGAREMGMAFMVIAMGVLAFATTMRLVPMILGVSGGVGVGMLAVLGIVGVMALSMTILSLAKPITGPGIDSAKGMGLALLFIAGGILLFAGTMRLVPIILGMGDLKNPIKSALVVSGIVALMAGTIFLLGQVGKFVAPGIMAAKGIGLALIFISLGVIAVALSSKYLMGMGDTSAKNKDGEPKGKFGQIVAGIGAGLGIFGLFLLSSAALFWALGFPLVSGPVLLGAITMITVTFALIRMTKAIKKVSESVKEIGGEQGIKNVAQNIRLMTGGIMGAVIDGVMGNLDKPGKHGESPDGNLSLRELRQFRRVKRAVKTFGVIATSLSKFAQGLRAFAKLGEIAELSYEEDENGNMKPKFGGEKIHVVEISKNIAATFGLFIETMIKSTQDLSRRQAKALKKFAASLSGENGLISGVSKFAETLKLFAEFGKKQEIYVPTQYVDDDPTKAKIEGTGVSVSIRDITTSITSAFGEFVEQMASQASKFEIGGAIGTKMRRFNEALMGRARGFLGLRRESPGILDAITEFSNILSQYAKYGKEGKVPVYDEEGKIIDRLTMTEVATIMVDGLRAFVTAFEKEVADGSLEEKAGNIKGKISNIISIVTEFEKMAVAQEGLDKLANSMGLLANNIGLLVTNMNALDVSKLQEIQTAASRNAVQTRGIDVTAPAGRTPATSSAVASQTDWQAVARMIANEIAAKMGNIRTGVYDFNFYDGNTGGKLEIKP